MFETAGYTTNFPGYVINAGSIENCVRDIVNGEDAEDKLRQMCEFDGTIHLGLLARDESRYMIDLGGTVIEFEDDTYELKFVVNLHLLVNLEINGEEHTFAERLPEWSIDNFDQLDSKIIDLLNKGGF